MQHLVAKSSLRALNRTSPFLQVYIRKNQTSHSKGAEAFHKSIPKNVETVSKLIDTVVEVAGQKDLLIAPGQNTRWTYKELAQNVDLVARGLPSARLLKGKTLAVILDNSVENLTTKLACNSVGTVIAHLDIEQISAEYTLPKLDAIQPRGILTAEKLDTKEILFTVDKLIPEISQTTPGFPLKVRRFPELKAAMHTTTEISFYGWSAFKEMLSNQIDFDPLPALEAKVASGSELADIHFTNTTPESADAFQFTQKSVVQSALNISGLKIFDETKRVCFAGRLHTKENQSLILSCIANYSLIIVPYTFFQPYLVAKRLIAEYANVLVATPRELRELVKESILDEVQPLESLVILNSPSDFADSDLVNQAKTRFKAQRVVSLFNLDSGASLAPFLVSEVSSTKKVAGSPVPNTEVKVVDSSNSPIAVGSSGKLLIKGANVTSGLVKGSSNNLSKDGWLNTQLNATLNADGNIYLN